MRSQIPPPRTTIRLINHKNNENIKFSSFLFKKQYPPSLSHIKMMENSFFHYFYIL